MPLTGIASAGVSALGGLIGGLFGGNSAKNQQKLANEGNMQLAEYAYNRELEQWNRENEYNTPAAQLERLKAAGLNPNLLYGDTSAGGVAANSPAYKTPHISAYTGQGALGMEIGKEVGASIGRYLQAENMEAQNKLLLQQAKAVEQTRANDALRGSILALEKDKTSMSNQLFHDSMEHLLRLNKANADNAEIESGNKLTYRTLIGSQIKNYEYLGEKLKAETNLTNHQVINTIQKIEAFEKELEFVIEKTNNVKLSNYQLKKINDYVIDSARYDSEIKQVKLDREKMAKNMDELFDKNEWWRGAGYVFRAIGSFLD